MVVVVHSGGLGVAGEYHAAMGREKEGTEGKKWSVFHSRGTWMKMAGPDQLGTDLDCIQDIAACSCALSLPPLGSRRGYATRRAQKTAPGPHAGTPPGVRAGRVCPCASICTPPPSLCLVALELERLPLPGAVWKPQRVCGQRPQGRGPCAEGVGGVLVVLGGAVSGGT